MSTVVKVVQPSGMLDSTQAQQFRQQVTNVLVGEVKGIIVLIDCQDVSFMDSSGLGALVLSLKTVRASGGQLFLCSMNDQLKMLLELTGMDNVFKIYANQEEFNRTVLSSIN
jgi:anti-anti-sigma factor